ncbi:MAG: CPBP family intramembrane metalloprotease [Crocinitomicaceae bacterium]|nr:CPBP family intramembrane metalloprotease [Crocinitomicaceae bacterium]
MKIFVTYIRTYFQADFKWAPHLVALLFLSITIFFNYWYDWYDQTQAQYKSSVAYVLILFVFYSTAFISGVLIISLFKEKDKPILNRKFLLFAFIGLVFLALDNSYYLLEIAKPYLSINPFLHDWQRSLVSNLSCFVAVILPLYILYYSVNYFKPEFYGFRLNGARVLNYFWLILFMIPLIWIASLRPDFLETYPTYNDNFEYRFLGTEQWITAGLYEISYGFDFISVELFFRGFLVVALSRFVGKDALIPMVMVYAFLHFGKPAGETISSIFGGYILGILAFQSRNIFGGLVAHLGVAWGMEYFAWLQL